MDARPGTRIVVPEGGKMSKKIKVHDRTSEDGTPFYLIVREDGIAQREGFSGIDNPYYLPKPRTKKMWITEDGEEQVREIS